MQNNLNIRRLVSVYTHASTVNSGLGKYTTVNELTDQLPATRPVVLRAAVYMLYSMGRILGNKVLSEDDKGAILAGMFATAVDRPLAMARQYPYNLPAEYGSVAVPLDMEYQTGARLLVNGIATGDKVTIIDDTLSTGGTAAALIQAVRVRGAEVVEMRVVAEKLGFGGRERLKALGINVKSVLGIAIDANHRVSVQEVLGRLITPEELRCDE